MQLAGRDKKEVPPLCLPWCVGWWSLGSATARNWTAAVPGVARVRFVGDGDRRAARLVVEDADLVPAVDAAEGPSRRRGFATATSNETGASCKPSLSIRAAEPSAATVPALLCIPELRVCATNLHSASSQRLCHLGNSHLSF